MAQNTINMYDLEPHIAEIYDNTQNNTDDVELIRRLIGDRGNLSILEPFFGTGRISLPLVQDGHCITGIDQAKGLLDHARTKIDELPMKLRERITLHQSDVVSGNWPSGFDLVILGGNCFYELATPDEQERCMEFASKSLEPGGYIYVDNDHMEGELASSWIKPGITESFPTGVCADGTDIKSYWEVVWYDVPRKLVQFQRKTIVTFTDGKVIEKEYIQQKHPVSMNEVKESLVSNGFIIEILYGDWEENLYNEKTPRAIFWAKKQ